MPARCLILHTYTVKNRVHGNPILRCPGNTGCATPHGVFPFHLEEVFNYTPCTPFIIHPSLYIMCRGSAEAVMPQLSPGTTKHRPVVVSNASVIGRLTNIQPQLTPKNYTI